MFSFLGFLPSPLFLLTKKENKKRKEIKTLTYENKNRVLKNHFQTQTNTAKTKI